MVRVLKSLIAVAILLMTAGAVTRGAEPRDTAKGDLDKLKAMMPKGMQK